ncbi:MAG: sugar ABC transporter ATP-binding protein [Sedimentisphaerales bacterium]|jgi:ribose transport system ATP-binding protein|nr:sugar ABC transporter ATP-binding protein [Sedimentisphaerales bacterium]NLT77239.1 sugar ABC transporter ATP-binding protein [Planctomycetota bacterium]
MMSAATDVLLTVAGIDKAFPGVQALSQVRIDLRAGEVHALVGENGAGKSTLTRILAGIETPDAGRMSLAGQPYRPVGRRPAEAAGVRMVMQELNLIANLSVAENIFIERLPSRLGFIDYKALNRSAREAMRQVGLSQIDPSTPVGALGVGQQQMVEIASGLSRRCRVLMLDEPTASLTDSEVELLFAQIARLKAEGVGIIYISHRIEEVLRIADRVTILRDGKLVTTRDARALHCDDVIRLMVGRDLDPDVLAPGGQRGAPALRVAGLRAGERVQDVSFEAYRGEILGVAGLMGSGRTETMRLIFGADRRNAGDIYLHGSDKPALIRRPRDAVRLGIALLTEDRKEQGLFLPLVIRANVSIAHLKGVSTLGWLNGARERMVVKRFIESLDIRCSSCEQAVGQLSGGNQQKVVIAKWLYRDCDVLIFDEPTRGIDVGAKFEIYRMLAALAQQGKAILFVSSDLKELMAISHRIMVLSAGRVAGTFARNGWSEAQIMSAAFSEYV